MKLNKNNRNILLYMCFGDGCIEKEGNLIILHCEKQLEYLEWKRNLLIHNGISCSPIFFRNNNGFNGYYFRTKVYKFVKNYRRYIYGNHKKRITNSMLNRLTPLGIYIWYLDDGSISYCRRNGKIHALTLTLNTYLTKEENQIIIDYFSQKWDIKFNQYKSKGKYRLACGTKQAKKLFELLNDYKYEVPCMSYKFK